MLFTLDGLHVSSGEESPLLNRLEGQQLVALYRLVHRLHRTEQSHDTTSYKFSPQHVPFPMFLHPEVHSHGTCAAAASSVAPIDSSVAQRGGGGDGGEEETRGNTAQDGAAEVHKNMNRSANGMEAMHLRAPSWGNGGVSPTRDADDAEPTRGTAATLQVCTSERNLFCTQQNVPQTNDVLFSCTAVVAAAAAATRTGAGASGV